MVRFFVYREKKIYDVFLRSLPIQCGVKMQFIFSYPPQISWQPFCTLTHNMKNVYHFQPKFQYIFYLSFKSQFYATYRLTRLSVGCEGRLHSIIGLLVAAIHCVQNNCRRMLLNVLTKSIYTCMRISDENVQFQRKINKHIKYDTLNDNC